MSIPLTIDYVAIFHAANAKAHAAASAMTPTPMGVRSMDGRVEVVNDGLCGFAWVSFKGNTRFGRAMKKAGLARSHYPSGLSVWISDHRQSHERKLTHARILAQELRAAGIECYADSRLD